jgi:hypothetical protein
MGYSPCKKHPDKEKYRTLRMEPNTGTIMGGGTNIFSFSNNEEIYNSHSSQHRSLHCLIKYYYNRTYQNVLKIKPIFIGNNVVLNIQS